MTRPIAAVTGGTGFLGRYVIAALIADGWQVRLLTRQGPGHPLLAGFALDLVPGDLGDEQALTRLVQGASAVLHVAGIVKALRAREFFAVNRDGTGRLAAAVARSAPRARFVLVSSQAARSPGLSAYAASKRAGEAAMMSALTTTPWTILRPCVVYGPWDTEGIALLRLVQRRIVPVPVAPEPCIAMIHARDAAAAIVASCHPGTSGAIYEISDACQRGYAWREFAQIAAASLGRVPRFLPLPDPVVLAAGAAADGWAAISRHAAMFGRGKAREILQRDWSTDAALQMPRDVWTPSIDLPEGLRETVAWWRSEQAAIRPVWTRQKA